MKNDKSALWNDTVKASDVVREQRWGLLGKAYNAVKNALHSSPKQEPLPPHHQRVWDAKGEIEKLDNGVPAPSHREKAQAYERHVDKFTHNPNGLYDGAASNTGSLSHTSSGKTEGISKVGEANRMFKAINKENELSMKM